MLKRLTGVGTALTLGGLLLFIGSCMATRYAVLDIKGASDKVKKEEAYNRITMILIDKGFDIKMGNKDLGLITTEYKQFASLGGNPPFDFYLQIKTTLRDRPDGKLQVVMTPIVKDQNRLNAVAFNEHPLIGYSEQDQQRVATRKEKAYVKGFQLFFNVVTSVGELLGLGIEQFERNLQETQIAIM